MDLSMAFLLCYLGRVTEHLMSDFRVLWKKGNQAVSPVTTGWDSGIVVAPDPQLLCLDLGGVLFPSPCIGGIILGSDGGGNRVKKGLAKLCSTYIHVMCLQRYRILWPTLEWLERSLKWDFRPIWSSWAPNPKSSKVALSTNFCQDFLTSAWLEDLHFWLTLADFSQPWNPLLLNTPIILAWLDVNRRAGAGGHSNISHRPILPNIDAICLRRRGKDEATINRIIRTYWLSITRPNNSSRYCRHRCSALWQTDAFQCLCCFISFIWTGKYLSIVGLWWFFVPTTPCVVLEEEDKWLEMLDRETYDAWKREQM